MGSICCSRAVAPPTTRGRFALVVVASVDARRFAAALTRASSPTSTTTTSLVDEASHTDDARASVWSLEDVTVD